MPPGIVIIPGGFHIGGLKMNFLYCFLSTLIIFYIVFAFATVGMNKAIFESAKIKSGLLVTIFTFILWPVFIKTSISGFKTVCLHEIAKQAAAMYNNEHLGDIFSGLGNMGGFDPNNIPKPEDIVNEQRN
jgi:hypothetical protein